MALRCSVCHVRSAVAKGGCRVLLHFFTGGEGAVWECSVEEETEE